LALNFAIAESGSFANEGAWGASPIDCAPTAMDPARSKATMDSEAIAGRFIEFSRAMIASKTPIAFAN